jgi:DNA-binding NarL/FixJ family response regulator
LFDIKQSIMMRKRKVISRTASPNGYAVSEAAMFDGRLYGKSVPTEREWRVIELVASGLKNREVAEAIGTTGYVVQNYLRVIYDKLGLWNRVELALWYEARRY